MNRMLAIVLGAPHRNLVIVANVLPDQEELLKAKINEWANSDQVSAA